MNKMFTSPQNTYFIIPLLLIIASLSCAPDTNTSRSEKNKTASEEEKKPTTVKKSEKLRNSKFTASASEIIDYKDIDILLLSDLIHTEINRVKTSNGLPTLSKNTVLKNAATDQNNYQIQIGDLSHTQKSSKKKNLGDRVQFHGGGFQAVAENVMYEGFIIRTTGNKKEIITPSYQEQAKKMVRGWMNSPGHRKNIMNPKFDMVGTSVGYHGELHAVFATQVFGKKF